MSRLSSYNPQFLDDGPEESSEAVTPTPVRRSTFGKGDVGSGIPALASTAKKANGIGMARRISSGPGVKGREEGDMGPPERKRLSGVGETF